MLYISAKNVICHYWRVERLRDDLTQWIWVMDYIGYKEWWKNGKNIR